MQDSHSSDKSTTDIIKRQCGGRPCFLKITQKGEGNTWELCPWPAGLEAGVGCRCQWLTSASLHSTGIPCSPPPTGTQNHKFSRQDWGLCEYPEKTRGIKGTKGRSLWPLDPRSKASCPGLGPQWFGFRCRCQKVTCLQLTQAWCYSHFCRYQQFHRMIWCCADIPSILS